MDSQVSVKSQMTWGMCVENSCTQCILKLKVRDIQRRYQVTGFRQKEYQNCQSPRGAAHEPAQPAVAWQISAHRGFPWAGTHWGSMGTHQEPAALVADLTRPGHCQSNRDRPHTHRKRPRERCEGSVVRQLGPDVTEGTLH